MKKEKIKNITDKFLEYALYGLIFFIPISIGIIDSFLGIAVLLFAIKKIINPDFNFLRRSFYLYLLLFTGFMIVSVFHDQTFLKKEILALIFKWFKYFILMIIAHDHFLNNPRRFRNAMLVFLASCFLVAIDGIYQYFLKVDFLRHKELSPNDNRIKASFKTANDFGAYLVPFILIIASFLLNLKIKSRLKKFLSVTLFLLSSCLILTFSRGAWFGFIAGLLFLVFLSKMKKMTYAFIFTIVIFLLVPVLRERVHDIFLPGGDAFRFTIWQVALAMIKENPFLGKGVGTFMEYFSRYPTNLNPQYAHNCFLQIWAETGIFSLISFLLFFRVIFVQGIQKLRKDNDFMLLGLLAGIFGFLAHSFFDTNLYSIQLASLFWMLSGLLCAKLTSTVPINFKE